MKSELLSVGIDVGTSTTQVVFSRISMVNRASGFAVPRVEIVEKEVLYRGNIYETPLLGASDIDGDQIREIVASEYSHAGYRRGDVKTGAVIITGEAARKENSEVLLHKLSEFAGDFVVAAAGPDLEGILSGKGSGAQEYSSKHACRVMNLDIGGGTTNIAIFDSGKTVAVGCLDIGGRLVRCNAEQRITHISPAADKVSRSIGIGLKTGEKAVPEKLEKMTEKMAELLNELAGLQQEEPLLRAIKTNGSSWFQMTEPVDGICFSGGVGAAVYGQISDREAYRDIGVYLGQAIRKSELCSAFKVLKPKETLRATVIGAGNDTITVSGSTIQISQAHFPMKNVPVLKLNSQEEQALYQGNHHLMQEKLRWFVRQNSCETLAIAMRGSSDITYDELNAAAKVISSVCENFLPRGAPLLVTLENDIGKALGLSVGRFLREPRPVVSIDKVRVGSCDYIDLGSPIADGTAIPVVVKTLAVG